ncbi:MAG: hypothetical protein FWD27_04875 [Coriobacteriia bacterium]|nr:hypothetical protein [Coriobacteriia bacterium]
MNQKDVSRANEQVKRIIGSQGFYIGRAAAMAWMGFVFGDTEYALHVQCSFRIRDYSEILVTDMEMLEPTESLLSSESFDYDTFHWDVQGVNRYDEWVRALDPALLSTLKVVGARVNSYGDLTVLFEQNIAIEVFANSAADECWRLFERGSLASHLVMLGSGIEEQD